MWQVCPKLASWSEHTEEFGELGLTNEERAEKINFLFSENGPNSNSKASIMTFPDALLILYILKTAPSFMASFSRQRNKNIDTYTCIYIFLDR